MPGTAAPTTTLETESATTPVASVGRRTAAACTANAPRSAGPKPTRSAMAPASMGPITAPAPKATQ
jgi:hypothetical protein